MAEWTDDAKSCLNKYVHELRALSRRSGEYSEEVVEGIHAHIVEDAELRGRDLVSLDDVRATIAAVGRPEQVLETNPVDPRRDRTQRPNRSGIKIFIVAVVLMLLLLPLFMIAIFAFLMLERKPEIVEARKAMITTPTGEKTYAESAIRNAEIDWLFARIADPEPGYHRFAAMWALIQRGEWADQKERLDIVNKAIEIAQDSERPFNQRFQSCYVASAFEIPSTIAPLAAILVYDENPRLRGVAACALGHFTAPEADQALRRAQEQETDVEVLEWIERTLNGEFPRPSRPIPSQEPAPLQYLH